jgi:hypothetical protein
VGKLAAAGQMLVRPVVDQEVVLRIVGLDRLLQRVHVPAAVENLTGLPPDHVVLILRARIILNSTGIGVTTD